MVVRPAQRSGSSSARLWARAKRSRFCPIMKCMADRVRELLQLLDDGRRVRSGLERACSRGTELLEADRRACRAPRPWRGKPRLAREFRALSDEARRLSVLAASVGLRAEGGAGMAWIDVADACG